MLTNWFCPTCGAANERINSVCFACGGEYTDPDAPHGAQVFPLLRERYQLTTYIGSGGFSEVYRAIDTQSADRVVAVKQINLGGLTAEESIEATDTFNREVVLLGELRHKQIPELYDHFGDPTHWYLVLEYIEGETLEQYLEKPERVDRPLGLSETLEVGLQLCAVLEYLHEQRPPIIFRDLKPGNVMRTRGGRLYLIDYGIARRYRVGQALDTQRFGSPGYAAPEQYGRAQTTPQADIYSLGAILQRLLTGEDPATCTHASGLRGLNQELERSGLTRLVERMLLANPVERPASVVMVVQALNGVREQSIQSGRVWLPPVPQTYTPAVGTQFQIQMQQAVQLGTRKGRRRFTRRNLLISLAVLGLGAGAVSVWWATQSTPSPDGTTIYSGHSAEITDLSWSPSGLYFASSSLDGTVRIWDRTNDNVIRCKLDRGPLYAVAWSPGDDMIATGCDDGTVVLLNTLDGSVQSVYRSHTDAVTAVDWSPDNMSVVSGSRDTILQAWDIVSRQPQVYTGHSGAISAVSWSHVGVQILSSSWDTTIQLWNASENSHEAFPGRSGVMRGVAWSSEDALFAGGTDNQTVLIFDPLADPGSMTVLQGHSDNVNAVAWSFDDKYLASASDDGTVIVWKVDDGTIIYTYTGHSGPVKTVAWLPDNYFIASGSSDKTIHVWSLVRDATN